MKCCSGWYDSFSGPWCDNSDCTPEECRRRQVADLTTDEAFAIGQAYCENKFPYTNDDDGSHLDYDVKNTAEQIMRGEYPHLVAIYRLGKESQ